MNRGLTILAISVLAVASLSSGSTIPSSAAGPGAEQFSGVAFFDDSDQCDSQSVGADFALIMTGDLEGCLYAVIESTKSSPSGTYRESGTELFVGSFKNAGEGTFRTHYKFEAKYDDVENLIGKIFGRCQHPILVNSGTGVFDGATGRIDFKDDVEAGDFHYRGHLR